jgi:hypothetical protein
MCRNNNRFPLADPFISSPNKSNHTAKHPQNVGNLRLCVVLIPFQIKLSLHSRRENAAVNCSFSLECLLIPHNFKELLKSKLTYGFHSSPLGLLMRILLVVVRVETSTTACTI